MYRYGAAALVAAIVFTAIPVQVAPSQTRSKLVQAKDGSGIVGYKDTPILPWSGYHVHDPDRPAPPKVKPGPAPEKRIPTPSDAVVLFDGTSLSQWKPSEWKIENRELIAVSGELTTIQAFGDCQLHVEWQAPDPPQGRMFDRGNNGVRLMSLFEIQIFDTYTTPLYPDGQAASIYGQTPPKVNACRGPGRWQTFDIIFLAPVFEDGKLKEPAYVTVFHNGILVHYNQKIYGPTGHRILPKYDEPIPEKLPLSLSAHNNPVRFRSVWIRPL